MSATLTEHQQFVGDGGKPIVNGFVYYGARNSDPVTVPIAIFSDRNLSIPLANPQRTDGNGRTVNKVWLAGSYSLKVESSNNVQLYLQLDNGTITDVPVTFAIVRLATTTNIDIALDLEAADSIDGVTLVAGDDVLVTSQTNPAENGVYVASSGGVALRAPDFAAYDDYPGVYFSVMEGSANADKLFSCLSDRGGTLEVSAIAITGDLKIDGLTVGGTTINEFSTDGTLADDSDDAVPTEKAVKTFVESAIAIDTRLTGEVIMFAGSALPAGWLNCDGSDISRTTFSDLFGAIGTAYGIGDGSTTFNLPDARGRAAIAAGTGVGLTTRVLGDELGEEEHLLITAEMPSHNHKVSEAENSRGSSTGSGTAIAFDGGGVVTSSTGGGSSHNNMPPSLVFNFIIKT